MMLRTTVIGAMAAAVAAISYAPTAQAEYRNEAWQFVTQELLVPFSKKPHAQMDNVVIGMTIDNAFYHFNYSRHSDGDSCRFYLSRDDHAVLLDFFSDCDSLLSVQEISGGKDRYWSHTGENMTSPLPFGFDAETIVEKLEEKLLEEFRAFRKAYEAQ